MSLTLFFVQGGQTVELPLFGHSTLLYVHRHDTAALLPDSEILALVHDPRRGIVLEVSEVRAIVDATDTDAELDDAGIEVILAGQDTLALLAP